MPYCRLQFFNGELLWTIFQLWIFYDFYLMITFSLYVSFFLRSFYFTQTCCTCHLHYVKKEKRYEWSTVLSFKFATVILTLWASMWSRSHRSFNVSLFIICRRRSFIRYKFLCHANKKDDGIFFFNKNNCVLSYKSYPDFISTKVCNNFKQKQYLVERV